MAASIVASREKKTGLEEGVIHVDSMRVYLAGGVRRPRAMLPPLPYHGTLIMRIRYTVVLTYNILSPILTGSGTCLSVSLGHAGRIIVFPLFLFLFFSFIFIFFKREKKSCLVWCPWKPGALLFLVLGVAFWAA
jgi:hypothetical protein